MGRNTKSTENVSVVDLPVTQSLDVQAATWIVKLEGEKPSEQDIREFKQWISESSSHRAAFEEMMEFWDGTNVLTQVVLPGEMVVQERPHGESIFRRPFDFFRPYSLASAAFVMLLLVAALLLAPQFYSPSPLVYATAVGEQKSIELPDGSTVLLNTNSRVEVDFNDQRRQVKLLRGEAHFGVFHDPDRPFEVWAGKGLVRAVGTAFTVYIRKMDVEVIVTEGVVELDKAEAEQEVAKTVDRAQLESLEVGVHVKAGNKLVYGREDLQKIKLVVANQLEKDLSWQQGMLVFSSEPLADVVDNVSRYTDLKIVIPERKTRDMLVGGIFKVGDTESLFEVLREGFGIRVEKAENYDDVVYLIAGEQ